MVVGCALGGIVSFAVAALTDWQFRKVSRRILLAVNSTVALTVALTVASVAAVMLLIHLRQELKIPKARAADLAELLADSTTVVGLPDDDAVSVERDGVFLYLEGHLLPVRVIEVRFAGRVAQDTVQPSQRELFMRLSAREASAVDAIVRRHNNAPGAVTVAPMSQRLLARAVVVSPIPSTATGERVGKQTVGESGRLLSLAGMPRPPLSFR